MSARLYTRVLARPWSGGADCACTLIGRSCSRRRLSALTLEIPFVEERLLHTLLPLPAPWCTRHVSTGELSAHICRWQQRPGLCFEIPFVEERLLCTPPPLPLPWCTKHVATRERSAHFCRWQRPSFSGLCFALTFQAHPLGGQTSFLLALGRVRLGGCTRCHRGHSCQQPWCGSIES